MVLGASPKAAQTVATTALIRTLCRNGVRAVGMQPVARAVMTAQGPVAGDALRQLAAASVLQLPPRALVSALLPPLATTPRPTLDDAVERFQMLATWADAVVIDGIDITDADLDFDSLELAQALALPVVLVAGPDCIVEAPDKVALLRRSGLDCVAWIGNYAAADHSPRVWLQTLQDQMPGRWLGTVHGVTDDYSAAAADDLDILSVLHALGA